MAYSKQIQKLFRKIEGLGAKRRKATPAAASAGDPFRAEAHQPDSESAYELRKALDAIEEIEQMTGLQRFRHNTLLANLRLYADDLRRGVSVWQAWKPSFDDDRIDALARKTRDRRDPGSGSGFSAAERQVWRDREKQRVEQAESDRRYIETRRRNRERRRAE